MIHVRSGHPSICLTLWLLLTIFLIGNSQMSIADENSSRYIRKDGADTVIVFVHGIMGGGVSTWTSEADTYWPEMLTTDHTFDGADIFVYSYPAGFWATLSIDELAENMRAVLRADGVANYPNIVFLSHSMGGLVTRAFLIKNRDVAARTLFTYFFSTPTTGSQIASIIRVVTSNPKFAKMKPMMAEDYLGDLMRQWLAANFQFASYCAYEKRPTYGISLVVDMSSAAALCTKSLDPIDSDHINIVKPDNKTATSYVAFKSAYINEQATKTAPPSPPSTTPDSIKAAQLQAIRTLDSDLSKDEMGLRQMFDMQNILEKNIRIQVARIAFRIAGRLEDFKYNNFTEGDGNFIMLAMEGKYHTTASGVAIDEGPHDVLFLVTTDKFQRSQKALQSFINSSLIPDPIKDTLKGFKATVDHDMELMIRIMNSRLNQHDEYFTEYDRVWSQYYKVINNDYATQIISLRPHAELVSLQIGKFLQGGSQVADQTAPSLSAVETAALEALNNWLCGKDESALRTEFDLIGILEHNIDLMTKNRGPLTEKQEMFADVFGDPRHVQFTRPLVIDGKYQAGDWKVKPGEIGIMVLTERYTAASSQLDSTIKSVFLPQDVKTYLSSLQATVKQNMFLAIDELNLETAVHA